MVLMYYYKIQHAPFASLARASRIRLLAAPPCYPLHHHIVSTGAAFPALHRPKSVFPLFNRIVLLLTSSGTNSVAAHRTQSHSAPHRRATAQGSHARRNIASTNGKRICTIRVASSNSRETPPATPPTMSARSRRPTKLRSLSKVPLSCTFVPRSPLLSAEGTEPMVNRLARSPACTQRSFVSKCRTLPHPCR